MDHVGKGQSQEVPSSRHDLDSDESVAGGGLTQSRGGISAAGEGREEQGG
jgi:hypothetical protein